MAALVVTLVSVLGGLGVLSAGEADARAMDGDSAQGPGVSPRTAAPAGGAIALSDADTGTDAGTDAGTDSGDLATPPKDLALPANSGSGRRVVFDMTRQRVWLVARSAGHDVVRRTYPVSGSVTDNLEPGTYSVYSRSERAWGVDDSGTMRYMVRFAHGVRAAIGFHDIPVSNGAAVQTRAQLGSPQSHGCIRQWRPDARALWDFAPRGTKVVVVG